jgi:hypothetical protein
VDENFRVLAALDWEGASTVPWEVVGPPLFITRLPAMHNLNPTDEKSTERCEYINIVEQRERDLGADQTLSKILRDSDVQSLAYGIKVYHDPGKLGFYCEILRPFDTETS